MVLVKKNHRCGKIQKITRFPHILAKIQKWKRNHQLFGLLNKIVQINFRRHIQPLDKSPGRKSLFGQIGISEQQNSG
jgi:hypothetical protein